MGDSYCEWCCQEPKKPNFVSAVWCRRRWYHQERSIFMTLTWRVSFTQIILHFEILNYFLSSSQNCNVFGGFIVFYLFYLCKGLSMGVGANAQQQVYITQQRCMPCDDQTKRVTIFTYFSWNIVFIVCWKSSTHSILVNLKCTINCCRCSSFTMQ